MFISITNFSKATAAAVAFYGHQQSIKQNDMGRDDFPPQLVIHIHIHIDIFTSE